MYWRVELTSTDGNKEILVIEQNSLAKYIYTINCTSKNLKKVHIVSHQEPIEDLIDRAERLDGVKLEKIDLKKAVLFAFKTGREGILCPLMKRLKRISEGRLDS